MPDPRRGDALQLHGRNPVSPAERAAGLAPASIREVTAILRSYYPNGRGVYPLEMCISEPVLATIAALLDELAGRREDDAAAVQTGGGS